MFLGKIVGEATPDHQQINLAGRLVLLIGPPGGGMRRLVQQARAHHLGRGRVIFPRRYLALPSDSGSKRVEPSRAEDAHYLPRDVFHDYVNQGFFALHWGDGSTLYGIGREIESWMDAGLDVVVPADMDILARAQARYPSMKAVVVSPNADAMKAWMAGSETVLSSCDAGGFRPAPSHRADGGHFARGFPNLPMVQTDEDFTKAAERLLVLLARS
ncbi:MULTISPECIES: hypothetical protein [unclassified Iodidimonas]|uniref:hypothetical protein n=1 Tax=unclassified Iodidimonas TaxID=2626145 RepID=UPI002483287E|nr:MULTISPECIES: hypothetical protein [unclassified Iodidimonas]